MSWLIWPPGPRYPRVGAEAGAIVSVSDLAIVAALIFGWGTLSARLERFDVTGPIIFVLAGLLLTHGPLAFLGVEPSNEVIKELAEFTLALVLFSDASRVGLHELRTDAALYLRLLGVALPLTIGLGTLLAFALASNASIWLALLVGRGAGANRRRTWRGHDDQPCGTGENPPPDQCRKRPQRRDRHARCPGGPGRSGNGEERSPAMAQPRPLPSWLWAFLVGVAVGSAGGLLVKAVRRRGWVMEGFAGPAVLGLAVCAYASGVALHGNGFIAAFAGGLAFGTAGGRSGEPLVPFVEETGALVSLAGLAGVRRRRRRTRSRA